MPVQHPTHGQREVLLDFWYYSEQLDAIGQDWENQAPLKNRCYVTPPQRAFVDGDVWENNMGEIINESGLTEAHLPDLTTAQLPFSFLMPINKGGNHWTSFAIKLERNSAGQVSVNIGFSDSHPDHDTDVPSWVKTEEDVISFQLSQLNAPIKPTFPDILLPEIERLKLLFLEKYNDIEFNYSAYEHTWFQPDGCACGAYAMANATRFLENKQAEENPGPRAIREAQLLIMRTNTAITGCSKSMELDAIVLHWMESNLALDTAEKALNPRKLTASLNWLITSEAVNYMIKSYAEATNTNFTELNKLIRQEVSMSPSAPEAPIRTQPFLERLIQLIILHPEKMLRPEIQILKQEVAQARKSQTKAIETIQETVESAYDKTPLSHKTPKQTVVNTVFAQLYQMQVEEAVKLMTSLLGADTPIPDACLLSIHTLLGFHQVNDANKKEDSWPKHGAACAAKLLLATNQPTHNLPTELPPSLEKKFTAVYCEQTLQALLKACDRYLQHHESSSPCQTPKIGVIQTLKDIITNGLSTPKVTFLKLGQDLQQKDNMTLPILLSNYQSDCELTLKIMSILTVLPAIVLAIKRLVDTAGKSMNFFQPLSKPLVADPLQQLLCCNG